MDTNTDITTADQGAAVLVGSGPSLGVWEERVYERGPMLPYKGRGGRYRFSGRFLSGYPKDLQVYDHATGWSECPNVNIGIRIQREDELFPECVRGEHDWSRLTVSQWNCKRCGGVITHG